MQLEATRLLDISITNLTRLNVKESFLIKLFNLLRVFDRLLTLIHSSIHCPFCRQSTADMANFDQSHRYIKFPLWKRPFYPSSLLRSSGLGLCMCLLVLGQCSTSPAKCSPIDLAFDYMNIFSGWRLYQPIKLRLQDYLSDLYNVNLFNHSSRYKRQPSSNVVSRIQLVSRGEPFQQISFLRKAFDAKCCKFL